MITAPLLPNVDERTTDRLPRDLEVTSPERGIERTEMRFADERNLARIIRAIRRDYARIHAGAYGFMRFARPRIARTIAGDDDGSAAR